MKSIFNAGDIAPHTATFNIVDETGKVIMTSRMRKGKIFPLTQGLGWHYEMPLPNCTHF